MAPAPRSPTLKNRKAAVPWPVWARHTNFSSVAGVLSSRTSLSISWEGK
jgi:hypothetical protein